MFTKRLSILICLFLLVQLCGCALPEEYRYINVTEPLQEERPAPKPTEKPEETRETTPPSTKTAEQIASELDEKQLVAQLFLVKCPSAGAQTLLKSYDVGGIILYGQDTAGETPSSLRSEIAEYQSLVPVKLIIAVDEEGAPVNRVSNRKAFRSSEFPSVRDAYNKNGTQAVKVQEAEKSRFLRDLGINVNLGPICDIVTDAHGFMYDRSMRLSAIATAEVVSAMVDVMHDNGVGAVLKHFPGYGNLEGDTHIEQVVDPDRKLDDLRDIEFRAFKAGIKAGAGAIMTSHIIVNSLDEKLPVSLSAEAIRYLRDELRFDGVIITDDITMGAITQVYDVNEATIQAILAGNDMILTNWSEAQFQALYDAVYTEHRISEERLMESVIRIIQWKMDMGLL